MNCSSLTTVTIPGNVMKIGEWAFANCSALSAVNISNGVMSIGRNAFSNCSNLTTIDIPNSMTMIGDAAFEHCYGLQFANIGNSVMSVGGSAFWHCTSLKAVSIGNNVTRIGDNAFYNCSALTSVTFPNSMKSIGKHAFDCCFNLTSVDIPNSVTNIGEGAFWSCSLLSSVTIPTSLTCLEYGVFGSCTSLTSIEIPDSVTSIGSSAFYECTALTHITIGIGVTSIGNGAFNGCTSLTEVTVMNPIPVTISEPTFSNRCNATLIVPTGAREAFISANFWKEFKNIKELPIINFADADVKAICVANWDTDGDGELNEMEAVKVTSLGTSFKKSSITSFNELQYFTGLKDISEGAFASSTVSEITLPHNIASLAKGAFLSCKSLASLHLPAKVKDIGLNALSGCTAMTSITVDEDNQYFCDIDGVLFTKDGKTLVQFPAAKSTSYTLPDGTTSIARDAFYMSNLESVELPSSLNEVGYDAFGWCRQLTKLVIPEGVTVIGDYILDGCSSLTSLHIPTSVTSIGQHICNGCKAITDVYSNSKKPFAINGNNFPSMVYTDATLHIPYGSKDEYALTDGWKNFRYISDDIAASTLSAADLTISLGFSRDLLVMLSNNKEIGGVQFDLTLPAGISIATNQDGKHVVETTERSNQLYTDIEKVGDNLFRIILMSTNRATIAPGEGNIIKIRLTCDRKATPDTYDLAFSSISLSRQADNVLMRESNDDFTSKLTVNEFSTIRGDVNGDYEINITDVLVIVDYILGRSYKTFLVTNADMDKNGDVNITDALNVVNIILGRTESYAPRAARQSAQDLLRMGTSDMGCQVQTAAGIPDITAMQMDVVLPVGCRLKAASLTGKALGTHQVMTHDLEDGRYRIVVFSSKKALLDTDATILNLDMEGRGGLVCAEHIQCFDEQNMPILSPDINAVVTGICAIHADNDDDAPVYNISGQRVAKTQRGINIIKGRKVAVK